MALITKKGGDRRIKKGREKDGREKKEVGREREGGREGILFSALANDVTLSESNHLRPLGSDFFHVYSYMLPSGCWTAS